MRFITIYRSVEKDAPPTEQEMAAMGAFIQELATSGVLLMADGLLPSAKGARARKEAGKITVTDGPFSEAKEVIGGFAIFEVKSKDEVIAITKRFLELVGDGESEIREMYDAPAFAR